MITTAINVYRQLFDQGLIPRCLVTMEGGFVLTNEAFRKLFGLSGTHHELKDQNLFDVLSQATGIHREKIRKDQLFYSDTEEAIEGKIILLQADGQKLKLDYQRSRVEMADLTMLSFEWQDVTEKVEYRKSLRSTYERLQLAASISNLGVWEYEFETQEWYLNEWMLNLFQLAQFGDRHSTEHIVSLLHPDDLKTLSEKWLDVKGIGGHLDCEFRIVLSDSSIHTLHCLGRCLLDTHKQPWKFVGTIADVTEQRRASEQLILERNRMASLVDAQNTLLIRMDKTGIVNYSNVSFRDYFGLSQICSGSIWMSPFLHSEQRSLLQSTLEKCVEEPGIPQFLLLQLKNAEGEHKTHEWELVGIPNHVGEADEIQGMGRDVTQQLLLNARIQESKSNLESLINNFSTVSIWSIDVEYNLIACNTKFTEDYYQYYGNQLNEGDNIIAYLESFPEVRDFWKAQYKRTFKGEQFELELEVGGHIFEVSFNPIRSAGEVTGAAIYGMDITDSKTAEKALRLSEERLHFAIEGNQYGVWDYDVVNDSLFFSASCRDMLGYDHTEVGTNLMNWSKVIHPDDLPMVGVTRKELLSGKKDGFRTEVRMLTSDGKYKWLLDKGKTYDKDSNGIPTRIIGLWLDISKQKEDEAKLNEYLQRLEKFAYITSHNLRLPVANIIGLSNMLNEKAMESKDDETILRKIRTSAQQIDDVIKEMNEAISFSQQQTRKPQQSSLRNIWFIDDDDINNMLSERLIDKHFPAADCKTFLDAEEALEEIQKNETLKPDAIFLDINMPRMNGWEFLEELEKLHLPVNVYMLTSSIDPRDQEKAHSFNLVKDFISKPLREERLRMIVE